MPDIYVLDKNVFTDIGRGNNKAAAALHAHLKTDKVYISRAAYRELVHDSVSPRMGEEYRQLLEELHIEVAPATATSVTDRATLYADNIQHKPKPNQYGQIKQYSGKNDSNPGDMFVAAEAKALKGKLWTFDQPLVKRAKLRGVTIAPESTNIPIIGRGQDYPAVARKHLGLLPKIPPLPGKPPTGGKPPPGAGSPPSSGGKSGAPPAAGTASAKSAGAAVKPPAAPPTSTGKSIRSTKINLADYPPDRPGPILRFFHDKPMLTRVTHLAASETATAVKDWMLASVVSHFQNAVAAAHAEFEAKFPHPDQLLRDAHLEPYRQAYEASFKKLLAPSNKATGIKLAGAIAIANAPPKDRDAVLREVQSRLSKVKLADGGVGGFGDAASAYINAMADLMEQLSPTQNGLSDIAADLERRAAVLSRAGNDLMEVFQNGLGAAAISPLLYYAWLDVQTVAQIFLDLGGNLEHFADKVRQQANDGERLARTLDRDLTLVSEQLGRYVP